MGKKADIWVVRPLRAPIGQDVVVTTEPEMPPPVPQVQFMTQRDLVEVFAAARRGET